MKTIKFEIKNSGVTVENKVLESSCCVINKILFIMNSLQCIKVLTANHKLP